jgi:FKBP-type peptidyl-prolyl cis-trans isomerase FklB
MRSTPFFIILSGLLFALASPLSSQNASVESAAAAKPQTLNERAGYSYGIVVGRDFKVEGIEVDHSRFTKALADVLGDKDLEMDDDAVRAAINELMGLVEKKRADAGAEIPQAVKAKAGYAYGVVVAQSLKKSGIDLDPDHFKKALEDVFDEKNPVMTEGEINDTFSEAVDFARGRWLADNAKKEGVKVTKSGLQYEVIKEGEGDSPKPPSSVAVHYTGTLTDGTVFDSSVGKGKPFEFSLAGGVIPGWIEAVQLMKPGSKYRFFIPQELGYGADGSPGVIPPYATLIFEIELLKILP